MTRWFNPAGPCLPDYDCMIPPLRRLFDRRPDAPPLAQRTRFEQATSPAGRTVSVLRG